MSDLTPSATSAQFRGLLRYFAFDPGPLTMQILTADHLTAIVAQEVGKTRDRIFTPLLTLAAFLGQILAPDHSCQAVVARLIAWRTARGLPTCSADTGGYCKARQRLPETLLPRLVRDTADRIGDHARADWLFHGRRVIIADGSMVSMPDSPENQAEYPQHSMQKPGCGFPVARIVVLIALATGCVLDAAIGAGKGKRTGEMALMRRLHSRLKRGDILLADSYFSSFDEVVTLAAAGVDVVMRQHGGRASDFRRGQRLGREDHLVQWRRHAHRPEWMSREEFAELPRSILMRELRVRVDQVGFRSRVLVVVTTLLEAGTFGREELEGLYRARWQAELDIRTIKQTLGMDMLRCRTPEMVRKEIWGHLLVYDLIRGVMAEAASRRTLRPQQLSFAGTRQMIEGFRVGLNRDTSDPIDGLVVGLLGVIATLRAGDRPDRYEPRVQKRRPKEYPLMQEPRGTFKKRLAKAG